MPTVLGAPVPPTTLLPAPPTHTKGTDALALHPRLQRGPFGRVLGGPIFRASPSLYRGHCLWVRPLKRLGRHQAG